MDIKVISFDIFQTLVDVNQRIPQILQGILGEAYTDEQGMCGAQSILEHYSASMQKAISAGKFYTMQEVYLDCVNQALLSTGFPLKAETVVENLLYQHSRAPLYEDVLECMEQLHNKFRIVLSSDSNHIMVDGLLKNFIYDDLFILDDLKSYKESISGDFFRQVVERTGVQPGEILHVGDSRSDVLGAHRIGAVSCWLNREHRSWRHEIRPDYEIHSLLELILLLDN
jgi:2-haloalkanoic acid dehalogenase type II